MSNVKDVDNQVKMALASLPVSVIQEARTVIDGSNSECDLNTTFVRPSVSSAQFSSQPKLDDWQVS